MMDAGKLRHRITVQRNQKTQDQNTGEIVDAWVNYVSLWAAIEPVSVREFVASSMNQSEIVARMLIRARSDLTADMRILHGGKVYNPAGFLADKDSGLEYMTIPVTFGANDSGV